VPAGYTFPYMFGFTHSETQCLLEGGFLVGFGKALQKKLNPSPSSTENARKSFAVFNKSIML